MPKLKTFIKQEPELAGSFFAAAASFLFVPPAAWTLRHIDLHFLVILFCLMLVISALAKNHLFAAASRYFISKAAHARRLCLILICASFFSAMLVTNDVALIVFAPLAIAILGDAGLHGYTIFTVAMQTVAANLGSMLSPIGNPQNLFLYSYFHLSIGEFFRITLPATAASLFLIAPTVLWVKPRPIKKFAPGGDVYVNKYAAALFLALLLLCLASVLRVLSPFSLLLTVCAAAFAVDKSLFKLVDYKLLGTFACFFLFCGNLSAVPALRAAIVPYLAGSELFAAAALSQVVSNVPAAFILAGFTGNYKDLILGVNIGDLGTLIASLASLISFRYYKRAPRSRPLQYLAVFSVINFALLAILLALAAAFF